MLHYTDEVEKLTPVIDENRKFFFTYLPAHLLYSI